MGRDAARSGFVMLFGPRTSEELETVIGIVRTAHAIATSAAS